MSAAQSGGNTVITIHFADGTTLSMILLVGYTGALDASDFVFAQ